MLFSFNIHQEHCVIHLMTPKSTFITPFLHSSTGQQISWPTT